MTFDVNEFQVGQPITFNFDELKTELTEKVQHYKTLVYTDDQVSDAKKDKANLNKLKTAIEDRRKEIKKECLKPYEDFEKQVKEIVAIIDEPIGLIDKQVKDFETEKKNAKRNEIEELWASKTKPDWLKLEQIWDDKWLNVTTNMKSIETTIDNELTRIDNEISSIHQLGEFAFEAEQIYHISLSLPQAIAEGQRLLAIQKAKEAETLKNKSEDVVEETPTPTTISEDEPTFTVQFQCELTLTQSKALADFCKANGIVLKKL